MLLLGFGLTSPGLHCQRLNPHGHDICDVSLHNYYYYSKQILHRAKRPFIKGFYKKKKTSYLKHNIQILLHIYVWWLHSFFFFFFFFSFFFLSSEKLRNKIQARITASEHLQ